MGASDNINIKKEVGENMQEFPVAASTTIYRGSMVTQNSGDDIAALTAGDEFKGHAMEKADNSSGSAGDINCKVLQGKYRLQVSLSGVAQSDATERSIVYASDNETYTLTQGSNSPVGRVVRYVSSGVAVVEFDTDIEFGGNFGIITVPASTYAITDLQGMASNSIDFSGVGSIKFKHGSKDYHIPIWSDETD